MHSEITKNGVYNGISGNGVSGKPSNRSCLSSSHYFFYI